MTHTAPIQVESGDEVRGPHDRQWHSVIAPHTESTLYTLGMLYWECAKRVYFAGSRGTGGAVSRHATRRPSGDLRC